MQIGILRSCKSRLESKLNDVKALLQAEIFDNELDSARHLHKNSYYRAAGMLAGVVLEGHLKSVCLNHQLALAPTPTLSKFSEALKNSGVIDLPTWRHISALSDIRNKCGHAKGVEPTADEVGLLIQDVERMIKRVY